MHSLRTLHAAPIAEGKQIMKKAAALALLAALVAVNVSAADAAGRWARGYRYHSYAPHGRTVYWVYRSPRFIPPPPAPNTFWWEFFPTDRVNTHMY